MCAVPRLFSSATEWQRLEGDSWGTEGHGPLKPDGKKKSFFLLQNDTYSTEICSCMCCNAYSWLHPCFSPRLPSSVCLFGCLWCAGAGVAIVVTCNNTNLTLTLSAPPMTTHTTTILRRLNVELEQTGVSSQNVDFSRTALASRGNPSSSATVPFFFFPIPFFSLPFPLSFFPHHRWKRGYCPVSKITQRT